MKNQLNSLLVLRVVLGLMFLYSGVNKLASGFTAAGYLGKSTGPFAEIFKTMAGNGVVNFLVVFGEIAIGIALVLGIFLRLGAISGATMMVLFYTSTLPQATGPISQHIIYIVCFVVLAVSGIGRYKGLDRYLERYDFVKANWRIFKFLLG